MNIDIVIPSLRHKHAFDCIERLRHVPFHYKLHFVTAGKSWAEAVNIGLFQTKNDVLLMDDDVMLESDTLTQVIHEYEKADIFGFKLLFPDGRIQHAGGVFIDGEITHLGFGMPDKGQFSKPVYTCHLTTSLVYIKRKAINVLSGMDATYRGVQFEDVDFSFRALKAGLDLLYLPGRAVHLESATKKVEPNFHSRMAVNKQELYRRFMQDEDFKAFIKGFPSPRPRKMEKKELVAA